MSDNNESVNAWEGQATMPTFMAIMERWGQGGRKFRYGRYQAALLGITEEELAAFISEPDVVLSEDVQKRIIGLTHIANALVLLFNHARLEASWLEWRNPVVDELRNLVGEDSVANYLMSQGLHGFDNINTYLEKTLTRVNANDRYLLCLGVCNTLIEIPQMYTDPMLEVLALWQCNQQDPAAIIRNAMEVAPSLENAIPLSQKVMLMKRPHLQTLVDFIKQQPNLDVAIVTSATREYVDMVMSKASPELLSLCTFVWTREDREKFLMNATANEFYKTLQNIPELMGYQLGRVLMMEHNDVVPEELHLAISPYMMYTAHPDMQDTDDAIPKMLRRIGILLQVNDILKLRYQEDQQYADYRNNVDQWEKAQGISLFDEDYAQKTQSCPYARPRAMDDEPEDVTIEPNLEQVHPT
ncbi:MAG TPA: NIF family HAD-type phosphatase [Pseudomonadales bacterium]|nr:NIF family HAD-type phosphatase [Pseudomonadales bacterium]